MAMRTTQTLQHQLAAIRAVLFDMDGVIYVGKQPLPGAQAMLDYLETTGRGWTFVTNNASMTSVQFAEKVHAMGLRVAPERILGSSEATALWLAEQVRAGWPQGEVIMLGMEGMRSALLDQGFELTDDPFAATYAVSGAKFDLTYADLANVALAIRNGARFIGTNGDLTFPTERGQVPGAGSVLALFTAATDVQPIVIGKPNPPMYEIAMHRLGVTPQQTMMIGDRYDTDIAGALDLGILAAAVLTGVNSRAVHESQERPPDLIVENLPELLALLQAADRALYSVPR